MRPLSSQGAKHFCQRFSGTSTPMSDIRDLYDTVLDKRSTFKEGDAIYDQYRDFLLRESERSFFLAVSCFRRALDLFTASSVFWAHVSLYYCSWFAAHSALGMFGCWVRGPRKQMRIVIDARTQLPGEQEFAIEKNYSSIYAGSHQFFWDAYYNAMKTVVVWTKPSLHLAVTPVSNSPTWAIDRRNLVNYQSLHAFKLIDDHAAKFDASKFPSSLQGDLATQFQLARTLLLFSAEKAVEFGLKTDIFPRFKSRAEAIRKLIYKANPSKLAMHSEESSLTV